jgi:large subunit ribosomal protein L5
MNNLNKIYNDKYKEQLKKELKISNVMMIPKLLKVVINIGLGEATTDKKIISNVSSQLELISGQKPLITKAKKDISAFKLRKGMEIGVKTTLRGQKMYDFVEKLFKIVLSRIRDFRGVKIESFDSNGNYTLGLTEQIVFPEIDYSQIDKIRGLEITFVTNSKNKKFSYELLKILGMPFEKKEFKN